MIDRIERIHRRGFGRSLQVGASPIFSFQFSVFSFQFSDPAFVVAWWMPLTERPLGSTDAANCWSHRNAVGVLHAIDGPMGTHAAALGSGNSSSKIWRYTYPSFDVGVPIGKRSAAS